MLVNIPQGMYLWFLESLASPVVQHLLSLQHIPHPYLQQKCTMLLKVQLAILQVTAAWSVQHCGCCFKYGFWMWQLQARPNTGICLLSCPCTSHVQVDCCNSHTCAALCAQSICELKGKMHSSTLIAWFTSQHQGSQLMRLVSGCTAGGVHHQAQAFLQQKTKALNAAELCWPQESVSWVVYCPGPCACKSPQESLQKWPCSLLSSILAAPRKCPAVITETPVKWSADFLYLFCHKAYAAVTGNGILDPTFVWCNR